MFRRRQQSDWRLTPKDSAQRCALCHGQKAADDWISCQNCGTGGHGDCLRSEGLCPTLGCEELHASPQKPRAHRGQAKGVHLEALTLEAVEAALTGPQTVEQRVLKHWKMRRLLDYLNLTVDDVINSRQSKRRVETYFKIQRQSERRGEEQTKDVEDDYEQWLQDKL